MLIRKEPYSFPLFYYPFLLNLIYITTSIENGLEVYFMVDFGYLIVLGISAYVSTPY